MELRLDAPLRQKLDALALLSGRSASATVRRLILAAHRAVDPQVQRVVPQTAHVTEPDDSDLMTTDQILEMAGIYMGPDPQADDANESKSASAETGP
jgi:hypothetical protein